MQGIQAGELANNMMNVLSDTQQQAKKADKADALQQSGVQKSEQGTDEAVKVSLSGAGKRAAATIQENNPAVQQATGSQNVETAQAVNKSEAENHVAAINNYAAQNPVRQTQKTINHIVSA